MRCLLCEVLPVGYALFVRCSLCRVFPVRDIHSVSVLVCRKCPPTKGTVLLGGVNLLEEVCHRRDGF